MFAVESAHRIPTHSLPSRNPHRLFILEMPNYKDRDLILSKAHMKGNIKCDEAKIFSFSLTSQPIYRNNVQKNVDVECRLFQHQIPHAMIQYIQLNYGW